MHTHTHTHTHTRLVSEDKYMEDRIAHVERNFAALASNFAGITRKMARMRDKGDMLVKTMKDFATVESGETKRSLDGAAECMSALENFQQLGVSDKTEPTAFMNTDITFLCCFNLLVFWGVHVHMYVVWNTHT